jgi:hypothetical protein
MALNLSVDEVLSTTRSVRKRLDLDRPVPREVLMECLELALQAPTGSNSQGWQWMFVDDPDKKRPSPTSTVGTRRRTWTVPGPPSGTSGTSSCPA